MEHGENDKKMHNMNRYFHTFLGDFHGKRCMSVEKSGDIFNDYVDILHGVACDVSKRTWKLNNSATVADYEVWEQLML